MSLVSALPARDKRELTKFADESGTPNRGGHLSGDREPFDRIPPAPIRGFSFHPPVAIKSKSARPDRRARLQINGPGGVGKRQIEKLSMEVREVLDTRKEENAERLAPLTDPSRLLPRQPVPFNKGFPHTVRRQSRPREHGGKFQSALTGCQKPRF